MRAATWLMTRIGVDESLIGDLTEQRQAGRSIVWLWRQAIAAMFTALFDSVRRHPWLAARSLAIGWSAMFLMYQVAAPLIQEARITLFSRWGSAFWGDSEVLRQLWVYYGVPFQFVACLGFVAIGWIVAAAHRRQPGIVIVFSATLLIPAVFQLVEIWRLLQTGLWSGWGWGSFRWALLYQASLSLVAYPLCVLFGGFWIRTGESA